MAKKAATGTQTFPCSFNNVNFGDKTVSTGINISRGNITPAQADKLFCGMRLTVKLVASPMMTGKNGKAQETPSMIPGSDLEVETVVDIGGYSVTSKLIKATLKIMLNSIDRKTLSMYSKRDGQIIISKIEKGTDDGEETDSDSAGG
jgi:hypothetical protein